MKAMMCFNGIDSAGLSEGFQGIPAPLLPIANKPLVEYYIELCSCLHIHEFLILDSDYSEEAAARLGDGSRWSVKVIYRGASQQMTFQAIRKRQAAFLGTEDVLCFNGLVFPFCDYRTVCIEDLAPGQEQPGDADLAHGLYWFTPEKCHASMLPVLPLSTYVDYFKCCQAVMQAENAFFPVPGYHVEAGIYTGMNVVFPPSCTVSSPAIIGNHVRLIDEMKLEGAVILGDRVMVDRRTTLRNAIVIDHTYVGSDLEIRDKIVCRDRIIEPESNTVLHLGADCLFMGVRSFRRGAGLRWAVDILLAILLLLWLTPWRLLFWTLARIKAVPRDFQSVSGRLRQYPCYQLDPWKRSNLYFYKLMLDKYPLLFFVFSGELVLVGESIGRNPDALESNYCPGVFCFSDTRAGSVDVLQQKLDDRYYRYNRSFWLALGCLWKTAINRLFASIQAFYPSAEWLSFAGQGLCLNEEFSSQEAAAPCGSHEG